MSIEAYDELVETVKADLAISEAENELVGGNPLFDARAALTELRRKHFG